jgi:hypothetical protein
MKTEISACKKSPLKPTPKSFFSSIKLLLTALLLLIGQLSYAQTGTWAQVATNAPHQNMGALLLLTNGTVMCHNTNGGGEGTGWDLLTPSAGGSYVNGTWTSIASMHHDRLFFSSQVLPSGNVYVAGGEYGSGDTAAEVYNPVSNTWNSCYGIPSGWNVYDGNSQILDNGKVLEGPQIGSNPSYNCLFYNPTTNEFTSAPSSLYNHDEAAWLKLPDSSILFVGIGSTSSNRYIAKTNTWVNDGTVPVQLYDTYGEEAGAAFMLPNGKAIFFGATQYNAIYTPSGTSSPGTWAAAADFPMIGGTYVGMVDAAAAMLVNGHILCAVSPIGTGSNDEFRSPIYFVEYDYTANAFTQVTSVLPGIGADSIAGLSSFQSIMLALPDGTVLFSVNQAGNTSKEYWVYTPGSGAIAAGKPTINKLLADGCPNFKLTGKLFNGISEGAAYGDDWQMSTNYPIIRMTNGVSEFYAKTTYWNRIGAVQTDSLEDTVVFTPSAAMPVGTYSLVVVVNGIPSNPMIFNTLRVTVGSVTNVACNGGTGTINTSTVGGISPYTYSWAPNGGSGTSAIVSAGTYTLTVTDANGCTSTVSTTVTQPATALGITMASQTDISCNGGFGSATANAATGGTSPYTYLWSPSGGTGLTASNLTANTYTIKVTDNHGCTASATATITQPALLLANATITADVNCKGNSTGSVQSSPSGGTPAYTYAWSTGATTSSISGLSSATFTLTVKDSHGCTATASVTITQPSTALGITMASHGNVLCNGNATGTATANAATGGTSPYTYAWTPSGGTGLTASNLSAGTYTITATDNHGCTALASVTITQPSSAVGITIASHVNAACGGFGSATANAATGGTSPYTYNWTPSGGTNLTASNLTAGTYTITATDNHGCAATASVTISQTSSVNISIASSTNVSCYGGNNGSATANAATGGQSPYTYSWAPYGGTALTATGLVAGTYTINVTDANSCTGFAIASITAPFTPLGIIINSISNISCYGYNNGSATSGGATGGTPPYTYNWAPIGGTNLTASNLPVGSYTLNVTDANSCTTSSVITITEPASPLGITIASHSNVLCYGSSNGSATANAATGGTSPYTYSWAPIGGTNLTASGLPAGTYTIQVTDAHSCTTSSVVSITTPSSPLGIIISSVNNIQCYGGYGSATASPATGGTSPYTYNWAPVGGTGLTATNLPVGTYTLTVSDANSCTTSSVISITAPAAPLTANASVINNVGCNSSTGSATSSPTGGTSPYTYLWSTSSTNASVSNLTIGTYSLNVTDLNGCSTTASVTITQVASLTLGAGPINNVTCYGLSNGRATVTVTGGTPPFTYSWVNSSHTVISTVMSTPAILGKGTYSVTVTDANGCSGTASTTITQPNPLRDSIVSPVTEVGCNGGDGGAATAGVKGGTYPYIYTWSNGTTLVTASNLSAGSYTVNVTDQNGCSVTNAAPVATITQPPALVETLSSISYPECNGGKGSATVSVTGGVTPYTYTWTGALSTTSSCTKLTAGSYTVTVKDKHSCTTTLVISMTQPLAIRDTIVSSSKVNVSCNGGSNGSATVGVKYGVSPFTYAWSPNSNSTATATGLSAGVYSITVTDHNGCSSSVAKVTITQPGILRDSISASSCTSNLVKATVGVKGGTSPYTYAWSPGGGTKATISNLAPGTYTIVVTDKNGCSNTLVSDLTCSTELPPAPINKGNECCPGMEIISLYPNPNTGQFTLSGLDKGMIIELYDYTGRKLSSFTASDLSIQLNISDQPNGIYLIRISDENGTLVSQKKIVKTQ